jgi:hypothetical protein
MYSLSAIEYITTVSKQDVPMSTAFINYLWGCTSVYYNN